MAAPADYVALYPLKVDANDVTGNYDGINNGATFDGQSATFDGIDDYIDATITEITSTNISFSGWVKVGIYQGACAAVQRGDSSKARGFITNSTSILFFSSTSSDSQRYAAYDTSNTADFIHIVGIQDGNIIKIYANKILEDTEDMGSTLAFDSILKMGNCTDSNGPYNGKLSNLRIYDYAISEQDIIDIYEEEFADYYGFQTVDFNIASEDKVFDELVNFTIASEDKVLTFLNLNITSDDKIPEYVNFDITSTDYQGEVIDFDIVSEDKANPAFIQFYIISEDKPDSYSATIIKRINE